MFISMKFGRSYIYESELAHLDDDSYFWLTDASDSFSTWYPTVYWEPEPESSVTIRKFRCQSCGRQFKTRILIYCPWCEYDLEFVSNDMRKPKLYVGRNYSTEASYPNRPKPRDATNEDLYSHSPPLKSKDPKTMMVMTEVHGVIRFINVDHIAAAKYEQKFIPPHDQAPTITLQSSLPHIEDLTITGDLADVTKAALETACYITGKEKAERLRG